MNVFVYGSKQDVSAVSLLMGDVATIFTASEMCPSAHALRYSFTKGITPRMRNQIAAMECHTLVVCRKPRYWFSIVRAFKARGRRLFWFNGVSIREIEPVFDGKSKYASASPASAIPEWELWAEQAAAKQEAYDAYKPYPWKAISEWHASVHPGCPKWHRWEQMRYEIRAELDEQVPLRPWNYVMDADDLACSEDDVLHPSHQR